MPGIDVKLSNAPLTIYRAIYHAPTAKKMYDTLNPQMICFYVAVC